MPRVRKRLRTVSRSRVYTMENRGILIIIPTTPMVLAPSVTAMSTQMDGIPTELQTTCG